MENYPTNGEVLSAYSLEELENMLEQKKIEFDVLARQAEEILEAINEKTGTPLY